MRRCLMQRARETTRARPCNSAFTQLPIMDTAQGEKKGWVGVMATCNNIVDSYCFVIGPCDATRRDPTRHERCRRRIYCAEVVLLEISRSPLRHSRNFSVRVANVTTRRFSTLAFYRPTFFLLLFFLNSFLYFFSRASDIV